MDRSEGLLAWQWHGYAERHRDRVSLLLHMASVPLFIAGLLAAARQAFFGEWFGAGVAFSMAIFALLLQGIGHRREKTRPEPFEGPLDFVLRFLVEQFLTFPRFVLSGGWLRQMVSQPHVEAD